VRKKIGRMRVDEFAEPVVVSALRLFPGIAPNLVRNVLRPPLQGLVLEAYGVGNGPDRITNSSPRCRGDGIAES